MKLWCFVREAGDVPLADKSQDADVQRLFGPGRWEERDVRFEKEPAPLRFEIRGE